ncbi:MAG: hypothetical protein KatS3mg076_0879 [Candidatus Binatia bacterium]|nr:MAG: hypothetical protein KatS3mg076_0879 [Candidatus Binatia bacterium]
MASLFTGLYPSQHGVTRIGKALREELPTLAESLSGRGYLSSAFVANSLVNRFYTFDQGFHHFELVVRRGRDGSVRRPQCRRKCSAARVHDAFFRWLEGLGTEERKKPLFVYLHYMDTHVPYLPPPDVLEEVLARSDLSAEEKERTKLLHDLGDLKGLPDNKRDPLRLLEKVYDAEVKNLDRELRRFFAELERRGLLENSLVVFTSDHGEEFRDHGWMGHGHSLYEELVRIPLVVVPPGRTEPAAVDVPVSHVDIAATILDYARVDSGRGLEGKSFRRLLEGRDRGEGRRHAWVYIERASAPSKRSWQGPDPHRSAVVAGTHKAIRTKSGKVEFYDLSRDPKEQRPGRLPPEEARALSARLDEMHRKVTAEPRSAPTVALDEETKAQLRELGYAVE